ncbi:MAG: hypothetical protein EP344_11970 [Bacteroidetes bacterium]|nr:MAG: hypothetical protein EP344_11970 [Bacteroidota bacterium]
MFTTPLTNPVGPKPGSAWAAHFDAALAALNDLIPESLDTSLENSLGEWTQGSGALATDMSYGAAERYCIRQAQLWRIYVRLADAGLGEDVSRPIFNRAKQVVEETPETARPADLGFLEGSNLIRKTLEHLRQVAVYYPQALRAANGLESAAGALPPSADFQVTTVLEADADPAQSENMFRRFLEHNENVRSILLGADAADAADILDNCLYDPGAGITPGQVLWIKSHALLRTSISTWLGATIPHEYEQVRCVFMSPLGKPSGLLQLADDLSFVTVSLQIVEAAQADDQPGTPDPA